MSSVGYLEAWARWFGGDATLRDARLWGLPVLWWGRLGKSAAFLAGMTLILDIIGPERLRQFSARYVNKFRLRPGFEWSALLLAAAAGAFIVWATYFPGKIEVLGLEITVFSIGFNTETAGIALAFSLALLAPAVLQGFHQLLLYVFKHDALAQTVRTASLFLFVAGFHFDMLAS